jgi:hypothetical protein
LKRGLEQVFQIQGETNLRRNAMKKLSLKSGCSILIAVVGAALPLSTVQAASQDGMGGGSWSSAPQSDASPSIYYDDLRPAAKGPQGPMRTDMTTDKAASNARDDLYKDHEFRFPLSGGG